MKEVYFQCPTCNDKYSSLEAQRYLSADFKFICPNCCSAENFRMTKSEVKFRLVEVNNIGKLNKVQILDKKMQEQLSENELHEGIYELLHQLKNVQLSKNKPSENMKRGFKSSIITDEEMLKEVLHTRKSNTLEASYTSDNKTLINNKKLLSNVSNVGVTFAINLHENTETEVIENYSTNTTEIITEGNVINKNNIKDKVSDKVESGDEVEDEEIVWEEDE
jgi:hypothetical protein